MRTRFKPGWMLLSADSDDKLARGSDRRTTNGLADGTIGIIRGVDILYQYNMYMTHES
jgi:hypothetical protein